ncbi:MAG TPA: hypothetical protein VGK99_11020 [Acidobacteriota bacterium]
MDFRLMDDIERYMSGRGLRDKYDHVVAGGAALGAITGRRPGWNKTFWEHLDIACFVWHLHSFTAEAQRTQRMRTVSFACLCAVSAFSAPLR